jgi:hypothetical protein
MGYTQLASNLYLANATSTTSAVLYSPAVRLDGASYITVQAQLASISGGGTGVGVTVTCQISDDDANWRDFPSTGSDLRIEPISLTAAPTS